MQVNQRFDSLYNVKVDIENQSLTNCCHFKIHERPSKIICKCKCCGAQLLYKLEKERWKITKSTPHDHTKVHNKGRYDKDVLLTRISEFMNSSSIDKCFQSTLAHLRTIYNERVLPTETARKIYTDFFQPDWITNWKQLPSYISALNDAGIPSDIIYKSEKEIGKIYIELPYAETVCKSNVFTSIVMFDGTFLKPTTTNGILLIMITISADRVSIPLACALVEAEDIESYKFFFDKTKHLFRDNGSVSVISDQHEAIKSALGDTNFVYSPCAFHIIQRYASARDDFFRMIKANTLALYTFYLNEFKKKFPTVYSHISQYLPKIVRVLGAPYRFGYVSDSPIESVNGVLGNARKHEVIYLFDAFIEFSFSQYEKQINKLEKYPDEPLTNRITCDKNLFKRAEGFSVCKCRINGTYRVCSPYINGISVNYDVQINTDTKSYKCTCRMMEETLSPCIHVVKAMMLDNIAISEEYYSIIYRRSENLIAYDRSMLKNKPSIQNLVPDDGIIIAPFIKKRPGRPKKIRRYKPTHETLYSKRHYCTVCKQSGHYESAHIKHPERYPINIEPVPADQQMQAQQIVSQFNDISIHRRRNISQNTESIASTRERRLIHPVIRI